MRASKSFQTNCAAASSRDQADEEVGSGRRRDHDQHGEVVTRGSAQRGLLAYEHIVERSNSSRYMRSSKWWDGQVLGRNSSQCDRFDAVEKEGSEVEPRQLSRHLPPLNHFKVYAHAWCQHVCRSGEKNLIVFQIINGAFVEAEEPGTPSSCAELCASFLRNGRHS